MSKYTNICLIILKTMEKSLIAAVALNGAIGRDNDLLWHISEDLKFFKRTTLGSPVIMGSNTFKSLGSRPLPKRTNIVVSTRAWDVVPEGIVVVGSLEEAWEAAARTGAEKAFVIGGGKVYRQAVGGVDTMYITRVHADIPDADTFFPEIDASQWTVESIDGLHHDEETGYDFEFMHYRRKG